MSKLINNKLMYDLFELDRNKQILALQRQIKSIQVTREKCLSYFDNHNLPVDVDLVVLKEGKETLIPNPTTAAEHVYNIKLKAFNESHAIYTNKFQAKKELQDHKIPFNVFCFILKRCNELLIKNIIWKGYVFNNLFLGKIDIFYNKSIKPSIDWGTSMKNKQKLLQENKVPYLKKDAEEAKLKGIEYNGIDWLAYIKEGNLFFQWTLELAQYTRLPNLRNFTFIPFKDNGDGKSPCAELKRFKNTLNEEQLLNFNNR